MPRQVQLTAHCSLCDQLRCAEQRYVDRMLGDTAIRARLPELLVSSLGFCASHTRRIRAIPTAQSALEPSISCAAHRLAGVLERVNLHDEFLQDILFSAHSRCPICSAIKQLEGRLISRVLRLLETDRRAARQTILDHLCFEHARVLASKSSDAIRRPVLAALRLKQRGLILQDLSSQTDDVGQEHYMPDALRMLESIYPVTQPSLSDARQEHATAPGCKVCADQLIAHRNWYLSAMDNLRLGEPAWMTLPTCTAHTIECIQGPCVDLSHSAFLHYLEHVTLLTTPPHHPATKAIRRRRPALRWFDKDKGKSHSGVQATEPSNSGPHIMLGCPTCRIISTAEIRSALSVVDMFKRTSDGLRREITQQLCLKHFADILIFTLDDRSQALLLEDLRHLLLDANRHAVVPLPFGTEA